VRGSRRGRLHPLSRGRDLQPGYRSRLRRGDPLAGRLRGPGDALPLLHGARAGPRRAARPEPRPLERGRFPPPIRTRNVTRGRGPAMKKSSMLALAVSAGLSAAACGEKGMTYGDWNSIIAVAAPDVWERVDDVVYAELERTVQTVRDEKTFTVTYQEPYAEIWDQLRNFRQLLMIGTMDDPWIQEAIEKGTGDVAGPGIHQLARVWSREQTVTLVVLPEGGSTDRLTATI